MADGKDKMVDLGANQTNPYEAKPQDFKNGGDKDAVSKQNGPHGMAEGKDAMATLAVNQCGPRHIQDGGPGAAGSGTPSIWGKEAGIGSIMQNSGEGDGQSSVSAPESVNLMTGHIEVAGYSQTPIKEVPEKDVKIQPRN